MNSVILSLLYTFIMWIKSELDKSRFWTILSRLHLMLRRGFKSSLIVNTVKHSGDGGFERTSVACQLLRIPLAILSAICRFFSEVIRDFTENSVLSELGRGYLAGFFALDISFFGTIMFFAGISSFVVKLVLGRMSAISIIAVAVGAALFFIKARLGTYLDESVTAKFVKASFGFENVSFKVNVKASMQYVYMSAALAGIIGGLGGLDFLLYALPFVLFAVICVLMFPSSGVFFTVLLAPILPTLPVVGLCMLTMFSWLVRCAYTRNFRIKYDRCGICLLLFLLIALVSTVFSFAHFGSIGVFGMYAIFIFFYFCIQSCITSRRMLEGLLKIFVIGAAVVSAYGILQYIFGWTTKNAWIDTDMFESSVMRAYSTLANPNVLGEYLLLALPICALAFVQWANSAWQKIVYGGCFALALVCLVLTQSRGCWIGFFVSAAIFITYYRSELWKILPFIIILLPFVLPDTIINRLLSVGNMSDSSTSYRVYIWLGTLLMLRYFWIGGIGLGEAAFRSVYPFYSYSGIIAPHSHNLYLQLVVDSGVSNLLVFLGCMLLFFKDMINVQNRSRISGMAAAALISGVAGFLVQSMFDYTFYNYRVMGIFFMVLAFGAALVRISKREDVAVEKNN